MSSRDVMDRVKARLGKKLEEWKGQIDHRADVEEVPTGDLIPNIWNPNRQSEEDFEALLRSIEDDGLTDPVFINHENVIVDGEHRWRAAVVLGLPFTPCVRKEKDEMSMRGSTLRHNIARGSHDFELEAHLIQDLSAQGLADETLKDTLQLSDIELRQLRELQTDVIVADVPNDATPDLAQELIEKARAQEAERQSQMKTDFKKMVKDDGRKFRLNLLFGGDEGRLVRRVLGKDRPGRILELCQKYGDN